MLQVLVAISQKFCYRKEVRAMQKLFIKKRENIEKNGQVSEISKTMGTHIPLWKKKRKMNMIAPAL